MFKEVYAVLRLKGCVVLARVYPLFSSSSGNSCFIGSPSGGILVDAGANCKRLTLALAQNEISADAVKAIFITHDHSDHISALRVFTKAHKIPVYAAPKTMDWLLKNNHISSFGEGCDIGKEFFFEGYSVTSFRTPHDAVESVGYRIETPDGKKLCICTDLGHITDDVHESLAGSDLVLLESNYDERMLINGSYPYYLKQRIASNSGHLSNVNSSKEVKLLIEDGTTRIILGHLSRENNTPQIAENTLMRTLGSDMQRNRDYLLYIAPIETNGMVVTF